jgi:xanthine dehydrogenase/oxidase
MSHETRGMKALLDNIKYFAGKQIRNVSAIAGNICTASPISDLNPVFIALGAILKVESVQGGVREIQMADFFLAYRKTALLPSEVLLAVRIPLTTPFQFASGFKQAKRRDDDIAIVNAGFFLSLKPSGDEDFIVERAAFAFGGMGPFAISTKKTDAFLKGKIWSMSVVEQCYPLLLEDMPLSATSPGGQIEFRKSLGKVIIIDFSTKFLIEVCSPCE